MHYSVIDVTIECIRTRFNGKDFKVYRSIQEVLLKAVAGEDHKEEQAIMMAVYGDTDLPPYKLGPQLSLLPDVCRQWGTTLPDSTLLICWASLSHSEMLSNCYLVRFAHLVSLFLSCRPPTLSVSAPSLP